MQSFSKVRSFLAGFILIASAAGVASPVAAGDFTVLAHPSVGDSSLSKDELKQVMMANKTTWSDGKNVTLVTLAYGSDDADVVTREFMGMSSVQAKKHWLTKVFGGIIAAVPAAADSSDEATELVSKTAGAVVVLPGKVAPGKAKVLQLK